jgi:hypothetical protein
MVEAAARLDASDLARTGRRLVHVVDPDAEDRRLEAALEREERAAHLGRSLSISDDGAGGVRVKGYGSVEDGAVLRAALLPMTAPTTAGGGGSTGRGPARARRIRVSMVPGSGTPSSRPHSTAWTPAYRRRSTVRDRGCWSPSTTTRSRPAWRPAGSRPPPTASTFPQVWSAGWPVTPT